MYTIRIKDGSRAKPVIHALEKKVAKSRFTATFESAPRNEIWVKPVRLRASKLYCGQHPGECAVGAKRKARFLEWDDWVQFNNLVNDVLDSLGVNADVWTNPQEPVDRGRKFFVRLGLSRRTRWEWNERPGFGRPVRVWNHGTPDQFSRET
jgi:hypothetical protein